MAGNPGALLRNCTN